MKQVWGRAARPCRVGILFACLIVVAGCAIRGDSKQARSYPEIAEVDFRAVRDGQYEGYYDYCGMAKARVLVAVHGGRVTSIRLLRHFHFPFLSGAGVVERIVRQQSLQVDVVSGATGSSVVVKKAVELALRKGL